MATSYPSSLDSFVNPTASDSLGSATVPHADQHANANDAIEAIETVLGTSPAGTATTTVANRVARVENHLNLNASVIETYPRQFQSTTIGLTNGVMKLTLFTVAEAKTITQLAANVANGGTDTGGTTVRRMGLFTVSGNSAYPITFTLVARTASSAALFNTGSSIETRSFDTTGGYPASYSLVAGTTYAFGVFCYNTGGVFSAPTLAAASTTPAAAGIAPILSATSASVADMATFTSSTPGTTQVYGRLS
jgi:hypothetical protein